MPYPWPIEYAEVTLQEALDIALDYLESTKQAFPFSEVEKTCAHVILDAWKAGMRHRIKLANSAIVAIESKKASPKLPSFYPRAG
jgi:ATP/maltotriose-dependent transcriptional regulator MalT